LEDLPRDQHQDFPHRLTPGAGDVAEESVTDRLAFLRVNDRSGKRNKNRKDTGKQHKSIMKKPKVVHSKKVCENATRKDSKTRIAETISSKTRQVNDGRNDEPESVLMTTALEEDALTNRKEVTFNAGESGHDKEDTLYNSVMKTNDFVETDKITTD